MMDDDLTRRLVELFGGAIDELSTKEREVDKILGKRFDPLSPKERHALFRMAEKQLADSMAALREKAGKSVREILFDDDLTRAWQPELNQIWRNFVLYLLLKQRLGTS
jgi:hypothetical protein